MMKLLILADKEVGLEVVSYLIECHLKDISLLITTSENSIYRLAKEHGVKVEVFDKFKSPDLLESDEFDLGILAWWPFIIKNELIDIPKQGFINFHPSFLPYNRGKHYNFWAIVEDVPFGVSLHRVDEKVDSGDIISQKLISYDWTDTGGSLYHKAQETIVNLFKETYPKIRENPLSSISFPQNLSMGSFHYSSEIDSASELHLYEKYTAKSLLNLLRARTFKGHSGCWFLDELGNRYEVTVKIERKNDE